MASNSGRKSGSSGRSSSRKRVVIGAEETTRVRYSRDKPEVESERRKTPRQSERDSSRTRAASPKPSSAGRRLASNKRDERDRRRRSIMRRRFAFAVAVVLAVAAIVWGLVTAWSAPLLPVKQVQITGVSRLTTGSVLASAAIPADATLPKLPKSQILDRLRANPWVAQATVSRALPGTVKIAIVERTPVALVDAGGAELWLVSADGYWLSRRTAEDTTVVPTIRDAPGAVPIAGKPTTSKELKNAIDVVRGLSPELRGRVKSVSAPTVDKTALMLAENIQVFVGSAEDMAKKDQLIVRILAKEKNLVYINVRVVSRPTWRGLDAGN
jgi:cell division protein FtsQ